MALYDDLYEKFRDPTLSKDEQLDLDSTKEDDAKVRNDASLLHEAGGTRNRSDGIFIPYPSVKAHIGIAMARAEAQFKGHPDMPEDVDVSIRFPGIDPVNKYGVIDMKFAQREAAIMATLESRSPEVQAYVKDLMSRRSSRKEVDEPFSRIQYAMKESARNHRILTRGSKLCLDPDGRRLMHRQARIMETDLPVEQYDKMMQGIEYAAGVRQGPIPAEITNFYKDIMKTELDMGIVAAAQNMDHVPSQIHVEFQDLDHKLLHRTFANPHNWNKSPAEVAKAADALDMDTISGVLPAYAVATADRVIDPLFRGMEKDAPEAFRGRGAEKAGFGIDIEFSRGDLISVDGKTIRETMQEQFAASGRKGTFEDFYKQNVRQMTNELVSAGLMAGKRVEAFVPNKFGEIPKEPTQITKTGYEPTPLKPEKFNAWQRHFAKRGYYKAKVERQAEYERVMAARERMKAKAMSSDQARRHERVEAIKDAMRDHDAMSSHLTPVKNLFFQKILEETPEIEQYSTPQYPVRGPDGKFTAHAHTALDSILPGGSRGKPFCQFSRSEVIDTCVCQLMAKGHKFRDIMDPNKLQKERDTAARDFCAARARGDYEWVGRVYYAGHQAMMRELTELTRGVDMTSDAAIPVMAEVAAMSHIGFSASQGLATEGVRKGYYLEACERAGGDLAKGSELGRQMNEKINNLTNVAEPIYQGFEAQAAIADPTIQTEENPFALAMRGKITQGMLKPGAPVTDGTPHWLETLRLRSITTMSATSGGPNSLHDIMEQMQAPENKAATARAAASGRLVEDIKYNFKSVPLLDAAGKQIVSQSDYKDTVVRQENGSLEVVRTKLPSPEAVPAITFALGKEAPVPPEYTRAMKKMEQANAPQRQAPQKQPPQAGGLKR